MSGIPTPDGFALNQGARNAALDPEQQAADEPPPLELPFPFSGLPTFASSVWQLMPDAGME